MKNIIIADNAGFCFGVKRAMNMAWNELENNRDRKVYALGPLIHNRQAVSRYEDNGLITIDDLNDADMDNSEVIIRSHGVAKKIYDDAGRRDLEIVDTTCPFVKKIHNIVNESYRNGMKVIVIGDRNHPEVIGINGWCEDSAIIIKDMDEAVNTVLDKCYDYMVVSQTTMNEKKFAEIVDYLGSLDLNISIDNTICSATRVRQTSARELAARVDAMVVIGGKHSSNTQKLVKICEDIVQTCSIETKDDLCDIDFSGIDTIGVTAGASTPDWIINDVIEYLESL